MTFETGIVFAIIALAIVLFFTEKFTIDTVAIGVMVLFMLFGILDLEEGLAGFSNPATITVAAMFVISQAIFRTGILNQFSDYLTNQAAKSEFKLILSLMVSAGLLSAIINDTAVVALLMPTVIYISQKTNISPSKLLMPLSFGALMGGSLYTFGDKYQHIGQRYRSKSRFSAVWYFRDERHGTDFFRSRNILHDNNRKMVNS